MAAGKDDSAREDFLAEAQELVERMSRDLLLLDQGQRKGDASPHVLNDLFRGVHTLKGLAGMFGFTVVGRLAHVLEDLLEHLRLGRADLSQSSLDVLFQGVESFQHLLASGNPEEGAPGFDLDAFAERVKAATQQRVEESDVLSEYEFDPLVLSVLTEYEEHRLLVSVKQGLELFLVRVQFELATLDKALTEIKDRAKPFG